MLSPKEYTVSFTVAGSCVVYLSNDPCHGNLAGELLLCSYARLYKNFKFCKFVKKNKDRLPSSHPFS